MAVLLVPVGLLVWRLVVRNRFWNVAGLVEDEFPEVRGKLVAAIQLAHWGRKRGTVPQSHTGPCEGTAPVFGNEGYSEEMIDAAVADVEKAFAPLPLGRLINRRRVLWAFAALVLMAVCFGAVARTSPARVRVCLLYTSPSPRDS